MLSTLSVFHAQNLAVGDLTPKNVIITEEDKLIKLDITENINVLEPRT
jgi:tRNA A-37 threonylcarbamoyl transferase component Bud32